MTPKRYRKLPVEIEAMHFAATYEELRPVPPVPPTPPVEHHS